MKKHLAFYTGVSVSTAMVADCLHRMEHAGIDDPV